MATVDQILNAEIPKPVWSWTPSVAAPLNSDTSFGRADDGGNNSTALDPETGTYVGKGADVPRIHGPQQGLYVNKQNSVNDIRNPSDISQWDNYEVNLLGTKKSVISGGTAQKWESTGSGQLFQRNSEAGFTTGGNEVFWALVEQPASGGSRFVRLTLDNDGGGFYGRLQFDFQDETTTQIDTASGFRHAGKVIDEDGPNGGRLAIIVGQEDGSNAANDPNGSDRRSKISLPDNGDSMILHHGHFGPGTNINNPLANGNGTIGRTDSVDFWDGYSNYNTKAQTFYVEFELHQLLRDYQEVLRGGSNLNRLVFFNKNGISSKFEGSGIKPEENVDMFSSIKYAVSFDNNGRVHAATNGVGTTGTGYDTSTQLNKTNLRPMPNNGPGLLFKQISNYAEFIPVSTLEIMTAK